jgi:hypothetical protein
MRRYLVPILLIISSNLFSQFKADSTAIITLLIDDYSAVSKLDGSAHRQNCTYDYVLVEEGEVWGLQRELDYFDELRSKKQTRKNQFSINLIKISGSTAYAVYALSSEIKTGNDVKKFNWLETAIFRKINNKWKIALIHSTKVLPK